jgi:hypothetical protein
MDTPWTRRSRRNSLSHSDVRYPMNQVLIKLDSEEYEALSALAEKAGKTLAATARDIVRDKLGLSVIPKFERLRAALAFRTVINLSEIRAPGFLTFPITPAELVQGMRHVGFSRSDNTFHRTSPDAFYSGHEAVAADENQMALLEEQLKVQDGET